MAHRTGNPGTCAYCGEVIAKRSVVSHLKKCPKRQETLSLAEASNRPVDTLWHLRVQDAHNKDFWLDLEMTGSASLEKLDKYLRAIWLECCGHLSEFTIGGWSGQTIGKSRKADAIFEPGLVLRHLYDFGITSETDIKVVGFREGKATTKHPIALLARNQPPERPCLECGQPAACLCLECFYDGEIDEGSWFLCDEHVKGHEHAEYEEPIPAINSPRLGMCGYMGRAEPPY